MKRRTDPKDRYSEITEVQTRDGSFFREVDTVVLEKFYVEQLSLDESSGKRGPGLPSHSANGAGNPYAGGGAADAKKLRSRSGLDYMRALSEEIVRRRRAKDGDKGDE